MKGGADFVGFGFSFSHTLFWLTTTLPGHDNSGEIHGMWTGLGLTCGWGGRAGVVKGKVFGEEKGVVFHRVVFSPLCRPTATLPDDIQGNY